MNEGNAQGVTNDPYPQSIQENLLALLSFSDQYAPVLIHLISPKLFQSETYQEIVRRVSKYVEQYGQAPKHHLGDLFEDLLAVKDQKAQYYENVLRQIHTISGGINERYVLDSVDLFIKEQRLKTATRQAVIALNAGNLGAAEQAFTEGLKTQNTLFDPGIMYSDPEQAFQFLYNTDEEAFLTGIRGLDRYEVGPTRKQLWVVMASASRGKSWCLIHLGKAALVQGLKVLHVTLELSQSFTSGRYAQSIFSASKNPIVGFKFPELSLDPDGRVIVGYPGKKIASRGDRPSFKDGNISSALLKKHRQMVNTQLVIKEFPTSSLSFDGLKAYLGNLRLVHGFRPDLLIVDYADLMYKDRDKQRIELQRIYEELRGLAVEENLAVATATQANRLAEQVQNINLSHLAEDYGKAAIADKIIAFCQTDEEYDLGLARLFVCKCRSERQNFSIAITQDYSIGQFCGQSAEFNPSEYWANIDASVPPAATMPKKGKGKP